MTRENQILLTLWLILILISNVAIAEIKFEATGGISRYALDVDQKFGRQIEDDSTAASFSFGAYRSSSNDTYWGAVLEYSLPIGRNSGLPGNGQLIGFRPVNYLVKYSEKSSVEYYAGIGQFDWRKTANGYYFGFNYRYNLFGDNSGVMADFKYYQDLAFDSVEGDDIVDGFNSSFKFYYNY